MDQRSNAARAYRRWYKTKAWRAISVAQLRKEPLCRMCVDEGRAVPATDCDHIEPHRGDKAKFFAGPFQSLCKAHHAGAKQREERLGYSAAVDTDGWPTDPRHPANARQ